MNLKIRYIAIVVSFGILAGSGMADHTKPATDSTGRLLIMPTEPTGGGYLKPAGVRFPPPVSVDWEALARVHLPAVDVKDLSPEQRDELTKHRNEISGLSTLEYKAPLTEELRSGEYYLISSLGILKIGERVLVGKAMYAIGRDEAIIRDEVIFRGGIEVMVGMGKVAEEGGFVLLSSAPLRLSSQLVPGNEGEGNTRFYRETDGKRIGWVLRENGHSDRHLAGEGYHYSIYLDFHHASLITVEPGGQRFLYVYWKVPGDALMCGYNYNLFEVTDRLEDVAWGGFNCLA